MQYRGVHAAYFRSFALPRRDPGGHRSCGCRSTSGDDHQGRFQEVREVTEEVNQFEADLANYERVRTMLNGDALVAQPKEIKA